MARPTIERNEKAAEIVRQRSAIGATQAEIASEIGIGVDTLRKLYREELDSGKIRADNVLRQTLYQLAVGKKDENGSYIVEPNLSALIFLHKVRLGMKETNAIEMTSPDGSMVSPSVIQLVGRIDGEDTSSDTAETD